jgi:hypothetical protein
MTAPSEVTLEMLTDEQIREYRTSSRQTREADRYYFECPGCHPR